MVTPIDQLNPGLLGRQPRGFDSMGASLLGPVSNPPATSITPVNIGSQLAAAARPTALGRVRGALERNLFDPAMLRGLASGLLTGPTRTPVSMGRRLTTGLLAGQQMKEAEEQRRLKQGLLQRKMDLAGRRVDIAGRELDMRQAGLDSPDFVKLNVGGDDVLFDQNPNSPTYGQTVSPSAALAGRVEAEGDLPSQLTSPFTEEELAAVPRINEAAQGEVGTQIYRGLSGLGGRLTGAGFGREKFENEAFVNNLNKEMQIELTKDLGGRLTGVVSSTIEEILPKPKMINAEFGAKANQLVEFGKKRIIQIKREMPNLSSKDKKSAQKSIDVLADRIRVYEAMLEKERQFQSGTGIYAREQSPTESLLNELGTLYDQPNGSGF
jgi:hypothetical protein